MINIGNYQLEVPDGVSVLAGEHEQRDGFDEDRSVRLVFDTGNSIGDIENFLEPFDPLQRKSVNLIEAGFYHAEMLESLDRGRFVTSTDIDIDNLTGFISRDRYPVRKYFYSDGRRAIICFIESGNKYSCTKTNYHADVVMEYRFFLENHRNIEIIDKKLSSIFNF